MSGPHAHLAVPQLTGPKLPGLAATRNRRWTGLALAALLGTVLTGLLIPVRGAVALESVLLLYLLAVVVVAVVGGVVPAVVASVASVLAANFFFTTPYHTLAVGQRDSLIALGVFVLVAATVSVTVDLAIRSRVAAARSAVEAEVLSRFATDPVGELPVDAVLEQVREAFGMRAVALVAHGDGRECVVAAVGPAVSAHPAISVPVAGGLRLVADGQQPFAEDRRLLARLAATAARAWEAEQLAGRAAEAAELALVDRLRTALLAAVGHDLRTPLSAVKAAATSLRQHDITWTDQDRDELLATIEESADRLDALIANLLAMSRLQVGALSADPQPVAVDEVVAKAVISAHTGDAVRVIVDVPDDLPLILADPGLLERAVANVVANAGHHAPPGAPVRVEAHATSRDTVVLRVVDTGPGVPAEQWDRIFEPFQRLEHRHQGGHGLGLTIARRFTEATGGSLTPSGTPSGGLTMTFTLPLAP